MIWNIQFKTTLAIYQRKFVRFLSMGFLYGIILNDTYSQCPEGYVVGGGNLITNGDFSYGNTGFESDYIFNLKTFGEQQWITEGMFSIVPNPMFAHGHFADCRDHTNGSSGMMVVNGSTIYNQVIWKQKLNVKPQTTYFFSTWICNAIALAPSKLVFSINGRELGEPIIAPDNPCEWKQFSTVWNSESYTEATITILNQNTIAQGNDFILDDIVFYTCEKPDFEHELDQANKGSVIELRNVYFDFAQDKLKTGSFEQLNLLAIFLKKENKLVIEIRGHTDNVGNEAENQLLSGNRAKAVYDYLLNKGISPKRMSYIGLGETTPIYPNETIEGRQKNRRVEFKILKK